MFEIPCAIDTKSFQRAKFLKAEISCVVYWTKFFDICARPKKDGESCRVMKNFLDAVDQRHVLGPKLLEVVYIAGN